ISIIIHAKTLYPDKAITKSMIMAQISEGDVITFMQVQLNTPLSSKLSGYSAEEHEQYLNALRALTCKSNKSFIAHSFEQADSGLALLLHWTILLALQQS
ncbi:MAG: hypothetical protein AAF126_13395, partial [Chloroflexota bacterium]